MIGQTVSHYKILEKLGEGGMGVVYKARDINLDRDVAIKFLHKQLCSDEDAEKRFIQEAKAASALDHPNICTIHEIDETEDGQLFICMTYYEGDVLKKRIEQGPLDFDEAVDISMHVAWGLAKAHEKGIVHRDIKPANIFVTVDGQVKIVDFGLVMLAGQTRLTKTETSVGTVAYMSPEQAKGKDIDHRTDVWSLGVVLYEMVTGTLPYRGDYWQSVMYAIVNEDPTPIANVRSDIPRELERIVNKAMAKSLDDRYENIRDLLDDLDSYQRKVMSGSLEVQSARTESAPSIAVLPFRDMSPKKDQEYFCEGIAEELINALVKVEDLKVVARSSSFQFKGKDQDIRKIGELLQVNTVLEGSVRKAGNRLRITAQLINIADGYHIWSDRYDREMEDIFAIQDEITLAIVDKLKGKLLREEKAALVKRHTEDVEAYQLYLRGRYFWNKRTSEGFTKAIECFEQAIAKDSKFTLAYAGLADTYNLLAFYCIMSPEESLPKAKEAATKALELGDAVAEANTSLAYVRMLYDRDWADAEQMFKRAIEYNPNYATAHHWYGELLCAVGRIDEATKEVKQGIESDPLSLIIYTMLGWCFHFARQYDEAIELLSKTLEMDKNFSPARAWRGLAYIQKSMFEEAIEDLKKSINDFGKNTLLSAMLGHAYAASGKREEAQKILDELKNVSKQQYVPSYFRAVIYADLGEDDRVFEWLEQAHRERDVWLCLINVDPLWDRLRSDPRFEALLNKLGLKK